MDKKSNLWHEVTEKEKEQIKKDSKKLLNEFASKISKIKSSEFHLSQNSNIRGAPSGDENKTGIREEGDGWNTDEEFREITFANAPFIENNSIVAEKGTWKK